MKFERRLTKKARVDMTPLVDVLFMLLLFFMLTSVFKMVPGISMKLPTSTNSFIRSTKIFNRRGAKNKP